MIDLHFHSTCSDGSLSPTALAEMAAGLSLKAAALTDHDTLSGVPEFLKAADGRFAAIAGVEISVEHSPGTMHLLGYYLNPDHAGLSAALARLRAGREDRNGLILERLQDLQMPLSEADVRQYAGEDVIGRPHIAKAMVSAGYVRDTREAFNRFLAKGAAAYCDRYRMTEQESIALIRAADGLPVLAHPFTLEMSPPVLERFIAELKEHGLQGIEVYYPEHRSDQTKQYLALAEQFDLVATGGTDFHGDMNPKLHMGSGFGGFAVPDSVYEALHHRHAAYATAPVSEFTRS